MGHVDFKPWTLESTINDLAIASQDGALSQFQLKRLYVDAEIESVFRLAPVIQTLQLEGPQLKLIRLGAGRYDIDDVLAHWLSTGSSWHWPMFDRSTRSRNSPRSNLPPRI